MKKLLAILAICLLPGVAWGATWYACGTTPTLSHVSGTTVSDVLNDAANCAGNWLNWAANPQAGDTINANAVTGIIVDVDPKGTAAGNGTVTLTTVAGGSFVITTGTVTVTANLTGGTENCLSVSGGTVTIPGGVTITTGATAGKYGLNNTAAATVIGSNGNPVTATGGGANNSAIYIATNALSGTAYINGTGGTASNAKGVSVGHTSGTTTIVGNFVGGSANANYGLDANGNGTLVAVTGNCTGGTSNALASYSYGCIASHANAVITVSGNCVGDGSYANPGCFGLGTIIVTGNILGTATSMGATGKINWSPADTTPPSNYVKIWTGGTDYYYMTANPEPLKADVRLSTTYGWDGAAVYTGELAASSGGAWAN